VGTPVAPIAEAESNKKCAHSASSSIRVVAGTPSNSSRSGDSKGKASSNRLNIKSEDRRITDPLDQSVSDKDRMHTGEGWAPADCKDTTTIELPKKASSSSSSNQDRSEEGLSAVSRGMWRTESVEKE